MADKENKTRRLLKANFKKTDEWHALKFEQSQKEKSTGVLQKVHSCTGATERK